MKRIVAALVVVAIVAPSSLAAAESVERRPAAAPVEAGPLLKASLSPDILLDQRAPKRQDDQNVGRDDRPWMERHPIWSGAIAGFLVGFAGTYLATDEGGIPGRGAAALVYGGVGAGLGALIMWGVAREDDHDTSTYRR